MTKSNPSSPTQESRFLRRKQELIRQVLLHEWAKLSAQDLGEKLGCDLVGKAPHVRHAMIMFLSEDIALAMSDQEANQFLLNLQ